MADARVVDLTASSALTGTELFYADDGSADVKVTATQLRTFTGREKLTGNRVYFVRSDGSDSNTGLVNSAAVPSGAFLTLQHAFDVIYSTLDPSGFRASVVMPTPGSFAGFTISGKVPGARATDAIRLVGTSTLPSDTIVTSQILVENGAVLNVLQFRCNSATNCLKASNGTIITSGSMEYNANGEAHLSAERLSLITIQNSYTVVGGGPVHINSSEGSEIFYDPNVVATITGTPNFTFEFANATTGGRINCARTGVQFSGAATGRRYFSSTGGQIHTSLESSGLATSSTFFPGDVDGSTAGGGSYD